VEGAELLIFSLLVDFSPERQSYINQARLTRMGQDASKGSFEFRYITESDCFRRKLLFIQPPEAVKKDEGLTRALRSVSVQCVTWDSMTILPEQWMSLLGNQLYVIYFVSYRSHRMSTGEEVLVLPPGAEVEERATYALDKVRGASPDAKIAIVVWDNAEDGYDEEDVPEEVGEETAEDDAEVQGESKEDDGAMPTGENVEGATDAAAQSSDDDDTKEPTEGALLEERNQSTLAVVSRIAKKYASHGNVVTITSSKDRFEMGCLLSATLMPQELSRPLCSLLYQLRDACGATDAFLVDSLSFYPLLSTLDEDPSSLSHPLHETLWIFATTVRRIMTSLDSDLHLVSMPCGPDKQLFFGWACRPYAYLLLVAPSQEKKGPTQLMIEKNLEVVSMHFYNVINNTTLRRTYTPMVQ
jgi:hypothetical protein